MMKISPFVGPSLWRYLQGFAFLFAMLFLMQCQPPAPSEHVPSDGGAVDSFISDATNASETNSTGGFCAIPAHYMEIGGCLVLREVHLLKELPANASSPLTVEECLILCRKAIISNSECASWTENDFKFSSVSCAEAQQTGAVREFLCKFTITDATCGLFP